MENNEYLNETQNISNQPQLLSYSRLHHSLILEDIEDDTLLDSSVTDFFIEDPYPVQQHVFQKNHERDTFEELLQQKQKYLQVINSYKKMFLKDQTLKQKKFSTSNYRSLPKYIIDITNNKVKDPDAHFPDDCVYNWYYTGGLLDVVSSNGIDYLTTVNDKNNVCFNSLNDFEKVCMYKSGFSKKHDVCYLKNYVLPDSTILLALRSKNKIGLLHTTILECNGDNAGEFLSKTYKKSTSPYFDVKVNKSDLNSFCTLTASKRICLYDIVRSEKVSFYQMPTSDSKCTFAQAEFLNKNLLTSLDDQDIYIMDKRYSDIQNYKLQLDTCDKFCTFLTHGDSFLYIATTHSFIKYDLRKFAVIYKYFHMMELPPYLMDITSMKNTDVICLGNRHSKILLFDDTSRHNIPFEVPSIKDTFRKMQLYEECHICEDVERRLNNSAVGLRLVQTESNQLQLYNLNTAGDLFAQKISHNPVISKSEHKLNNWIKSRPEANKLPLLVTGLTENSSVRFALNRETNKTALKTMEKPHPVPFQKNRRLYETMEDHFGNHLEEIWLADEGEAVSEDEALVPEMRTSDKVSAWLSSQFDNATSQDTAN